MKTVKRAMPPVHPGEILLEDFLKPMGITQYRLAKSIGVPQRRIGEIIAGRRSITADTALRLARFFRHGSPELDRTCRPTTILRSHRKSSTAGSRKRCSRTMLQPRWLSL
jgi:addiction module HigA family antidote